MQKNYLRLFLLGALMLLFVSGCSKPAYIPKGNVSCPVDIAWSVAPEADVTSFACAIANYQDNPAVELKVGIKNISDKEKQFRILIFLPKEGFGTGGFVPPSGDPMALKPGQEEVSTYTIPTAVKLPQKMEVTVKGLP